MTELPLLFLFGVLVELYEESRGEMSNKKGRKDIQLELVSLGCMSIFILFGMTYMQREEKKVYVTVSRCFT